MIEMNTTKGAISISSSVVANITGNAATNCFGVKGMAYRSMTDGLVHLLRKEAMSKAAERICDNWFSATPDSDGGNMYGGIEAAYGQVQGEIMASMNRQTMQVEKYLMELELKLKHGQEAIDAAITAVEEINRKLDAHKDTLNALRSGLN